MLPYWNPYLYSKGFNATEIAYITAIIAATKIFAPYLWGWLADHINNRMQVIQLASLICLLVFPAVIWIDSFIVMLLVIFLFSFFWNASLPQFEATTLSHLDTQVERYSQIRLWGSIGFIVAVLLAGYIFDRYSIRWQPYVMILIFSGVFINSLLIKDKAAKQLQINDQSVTAILKQPNIILLFFLCFLMQCSHGAYYTFYSIYLHSHGYSESVTGWLWALGTFAEIFVFIFMHKIIRHYHAATLLVLCFLLTTIRWLFMAYMVDNLLVMMLIQLLHASSFGLFHATAIHLVYQFFQGKLQGRGQALYSASSFGIGGAIGALISGYIWPYSHQLTFICMAAIAAIGIIMSFYIKPLKT